MTELRRVVDVDGLMLLVDTESGMPSQRMRWFQWAGEAMPSVGSYVRTAGNLAFVGVEPVAAAPRV